MFRIQKEERCCCVLRVPSKWMSDESTTQQHAPTTLSATLA